MWNVINRFVTPVRPIILMFHRVAQPLVDPWHLAVSPEHFASQMEALVEKRAPLAMDEFVRHHLAGSLPHNAVAVTFDDGYRDNVKVAAPILAALGIPSTLFVTTAYLGSDREFWWDELARLILSHRGPARWDVPGHDGTIAYGAADDASRSAAFHQIWTMLRDLPLDQIEARLDCLAAQSRAPGAVQADLPTGSSDLRRCVQGGLMSLGAHTRTHPALTRLPADRLRAEIAAGKADVEQIAGAAVSGMAYPYGDCNREVAEAARDTGIRWACTTRRAPVRGSQVMLLPRVQVPDCTGEQLLRQIKDIPSRRP